MNLKLTDHAERRLRQRGISKDDVICALHHPAGTTRPGQPGSRWVYGYALGGRILKVCIALDDPSRVITAVWPSDEG